MSGAAAGTAILWLVVALAALAVVWLALIAPARLRGARLASRYAHRGLYGGADGVCENTLSAFERAIQAGVGIELDVQLTADGVLVVFHDARMTRLLGDDTRVSERTLAELAALRLPDGEAVPTFRQALDVIAGRAPLLVEVKPYNRTTETARLTLEALRDYRGAWAMESFHPGIVRYFRKRTAGVPCGQLVSRGDGVPLPLAACMRSLILNAWSRPHFIACSLPVGFAARLFRRVFRAPVACWTVRTPEDWRRASAFDAAIFEGGAPANGEGD